MFEGQALVYDAEKRRSYWRGLVRFNFAVLFLKVCSSFLIFRVYLRLV
jgi:hypothetical protein